MQGKNAASLQSNIEALNRFWNRTTFHDMSIEKIDRFNKRVVIWLEDYALIVTGVTRFQGSIDELPTSWLNASIEGSRNHFCLRVETETGDFAVTGADVRLLRAKDLAILIPPLDQSAP